MLDKKLYYIKKIILGVSAIIAVIASGITIVNYYENYTHHNISGVWIIKNTVTKGLYKNSIIEFKVFITQKGKVFTAEGEKKSFNYKEIKDNEKVRLEFIDGVISSGVAKITFIEHGIKRQTRGSFQWNIINENKITGHFTSTTNAIGTSIGNKVN